METTPSGIYPILYAYFGADGALDREAMRRQVECCLAAGAHGIAILGLITEVNALTEKERQQIVDDARRKLQDERPLCEDWLSIQGMRVEEIGILLRCDIID